MMILIGFIQGVNWRKVRDAVHTRVQVWHLGNRRKEGRLRSPGLRPWYNGLSVDCQKPSSKQAVIPWPKRWLPTKGPVPYLWTEMSLKAFSQIRCHMHKVPPCTEFWVTHVRMCMHLITPFAGLFVNPLSSEGDFCEQSICQLCS